MKKSVMFLNSVKKGKYTVPVIFIVLLLLFSGIILSGTQSGTSIPGVGDDPFFCVFIVKQVVKNFETGLNPYQDRFWDIGMFFPEKRALALSDTFITHGFISYILKIIFQIEIIRSVEIIFAFSFLINWFCCYLFFQVYFRNPVIPIFGGWVWAFSSFMLTQSAHFQNVLAFGIPLGLYSTIKICNSPGLSILSVFLLILSLFSLAGASLYYFYFTVLILPFFFLFSVFFSKRIQSKIQLSLKFLRFIFSYVLALSACAPVLWRFIEVQTFHPTIIKTRAFSAQQFYSAGWADYFTNLLVSPLYREILPLSEQFERSNFSGLFTIIFSIAGLIFLFRERSYFRQLLSGILVLLCLGIFLSSGALFAPAIFKDLREMIPGFSGMRAIGRAGILVVLAESLASAFFLDFLIKQIRNKFNFKGIIFTLLAFLIINFQVGERIIPEFWKWNIDIGPKMRGDDILLNRIKESAKEPVFEINLNSANPLEMEVEAIKRGIFHNFILVNGYSGYNRDHFWVLKSNLPSCNLNDSDFKRLFDSAQIVLYEITKSRSEIEYCMKKMGFHYSGSDLKTLIYEK